MSTNSLNIKLPNDVAQLLEDFSQENGTSKKEVVSQALRQFIAIKTHEIELQGDHPESRITAKVEFKARKDRESRSLASVLIY